MNTNSTNGSAAAPGMTKTRHPQLSPHLLALPHRAQHGDRDAFADPHLTFHDAAARNVAVRMHERDRDAIAEPAGIAAARRAYGLRPYGVSAVFDFLPAWPLLVSSAADHITGQRVGRIGGRHG